MENSPSALRSTSTPSPLRASACREAPPSPLIITSSMSEVNRYLLILPRADTSFRVNHALPWYVAIVKCIIGVVGEYFESDPYLSDNSL